MNPKIYLEIKENTHRSQGGAKRIPLTHDSRHTTLDTFIQEE